jgi:CheY-like chemotaxis protein
MRKPIIILMADDDSEDCMLAQEALAHVNMEHEVHTVPDGVALMDYLHRRGLYESFQGRPLPGLILLDLNLPRMSGMEALRQIKSDPLLRRIPTVVLTTSEMEEDVQRSYDFGANSFVTKSVTFSSLVEVVEEIGKYWLEVVQLPPEKLSPHP